MDLFGNDNKEITVEESLFPTEEEVTAEVEKSSKYKLSLAERYANHAGVSVDEALTAVEQGTYLNLFDKEDAAGPTIMERAVTENYDPIKFKSALEVYNKNTGYLANAEESKDLVEDIVVDRFDPNIDQRALTLSILMDAFQAAAPQESIAGYASSAFGMLARSVVVDPLENVLGVTGTTLGSFEGKSKTGREQYMAVFLEPSLKKKKLLAMQFAQEAKNLGAFGDNSLLYWQRFNTITEMGKNENEDIWLGIDIAGLVPIGKVLGLGGKAAKTTGVASKIALATDALEVAEATGGKAAANSVMDTALSNAATSINTPKHAAPSTSSVGSNGLGPTLKPTLSNEVSNDYLAKIESAYRDMYTPEMLQAAKDRYKAFIEKTTKQHVLDISEKNLGLDNYAVKITMGREDGLPFKDWANAQKFSKNFGGTVEPYGVNAAGNNPEGYVVTFERNLNMKGLATATETGELRSSLFDFLASPEVTSSQRLADVLKRGLDKIGYVETEIMRNHNKVIKGLSKNDLRGIDQVISKINIENSDWYDLSTFKDIYYKQTGREATQAVQDAYISTYKVAETARWLEADKVMKRTTGEKINQFVGSGDGVNFYRMKSIPKGSLPQADQYRQKWVYDLNTGKVISSSDFFKNKKKETLYQLVDVDNVPEIDGKKVLYATGTLKTSRPLMPSDVVPKIAGGFRSTGNVHGFLISKRISSDLSGNILNLTPKIAFVGRTAKELADAAKDINTSLKTLRGVNDGSITKEAAEAIIKANNGFNPSIEDLDTFQKFLKNTDIDEMLDVEAVTKETELPTVGVGQFENYRLGKFTTYEDLYAKGAKDNQVLYGYGGGKFKQLDALVSIERDFAKGVNYIAEREYSYKAIEGFLKGAKDNNLITNLKEIEDSSFIEQVRRAKFVNSKSGDLFRTEQRVILNRLNETNDFANAWNRRMKGFGEFIFDKTKGFDIIDKMNVRPDVALRSFAFDLKLGLFNPDQLIVQSMSALNIIAIHPIYGFKAASSYLPMRYAMINRDPAVLKELYKRTKYALGMSEKEFLESVDYMYRSGRFQVNQNISEINSTYDVTRGVVRNIREKGRVFFNEGDRVARLMATNVAYREFRKAYPTLDVSTASGFRVMDDFITRKADVLTNNMTRASAAGWQQGFMSLPTQWIGYQAKLMENIFFGRNLTGWQRARLGLAQMAFFGAAGMPFAGNALNLFVDQTSEGIDKDMYTLLRYGLLDYTLSSITGEDTAFSGRLGPGEGIQQIYEGIMDKNFVEVLGGPAGSIAYDSGAGAIGLVASLFTTDVSIKQYDLTKVLRNISSFDKGVKAYYLIQTGEFINKKGQALAEGMSPWNALWNTLGVPFQEVEMYYDLKNSLYSEGQMVSDVSNRVQELNRLTTKYIQDGDLKSAEGIRDEVLSLMAPLSIWQKQQVIRRSRESWIGLGQSAIIQDSKTAKDGLSRQFQKLISKEGQ